MVNTDKLKNESKNCLFCAKDHWITQCPDARKVESHTIISKLRNAKACLCCLKRGHLKEDCRLKDKIKCFHCAKYEPKNANTHHTLLCKSKLKNAAPKKEPILAIKESSKQDDKDSDSSESTE